MIVWEGCYCFLNLGMYLLVVLYDVCCVFDVFDVGGVVLYLVILVVCCGGVGYGFFEFFEGGGEFSMGEF